MSGTREHCGRSRQQAPRCRTVRFGLGESEFADLEAAAARSGLARGAYAAEAALAVARGGITATGNELLRDALADWSDPPGWSAG